MDLSNFYYFKEGSKAHGLVVVNREIDETVYARGEADVGKPVIFRHHMGGRRYDILYAGVGLSLLSDRVINTFRAHKLTGWKTYPVEVYDKKRNLVPGYALFGVTGRAGPLDDESGERVVKSPRVPGGKPVAVRRGQVFNPATWDGNDFFILQGSLHIMVTERVKAALAPLKPKNIDFIPLLEYEVSESLIAMINQHRKENSVA